MAQPITQRTLGIDIGGTSIKGALMEGEREVWTGKTGEYARPDREGLEDALEGLVREIPEGVRIGAVGVCAPGLRDANGVIVRAVNVPGLEGVSAAGLVYGEMCEVLGTTFANRQGVGAVFEFTDAHAAAVDCWRVRPGNGRMLAISLGTGVGACVLDARENREPVPLIVTGRGPGQIGQMDVGEVAFERIDGEGAQTSHVWAGKPIALPLGPDGGRGTLEAYVGLPALRARFGDDLMGAIASGAMRADRPPLSALVKALRIAHAIYLPERIVLLGGVGIRLRPLVGEMRERIADGLTTLARRDWTLECGESDFHAARGAAWMAGRG